MDLSGLPFISIGFTLDHIFDGSVLTSTPDGLQ